MRKNVEMIKTELSICYFVYERKRQQGEVKAGRLFSEEDITHRSPFTMQGT